jgi:hypothetical protein
MNEPSPVTVDNNSRLVQVLDNYLAALQAGNAPPREELLARHPDLAEDLKICLSSLEYIRQAGVRSSAVGAGHGPADPGRTPQVLGDFRIVREVGRGGMGIVYEAEQLSLGRRVALKVLPFAATLDPRHLQRFKNEAQAAAQLHHTHIVPVFGVGSDRGVHYYAMQFIEGQTLAGVIRDLRALAESQRQPRLPTPPQDEPTTQAQGEPYEATGRAAPCPRKARPAAPASSAPWPNWASRPPRPWNTRTRWASSTATSSRPT